MRLTADIWKLPARIGATARDAARGVLLFFGTYSLLNSLVAAIGGRHEDLWWIDYAFLPSVLGAVVGLLAAVLMLWYAVQPAVDDRRRFLTAVATATLATVALSNTLGFYAAWADGTVNPGVPVPFSAILACMFTWLTLQVWRSGGDGSAKRGRLSVVAVAVLAAMVFPLAHVAFFGTTDYRRPASAAVILGAKVHSDGRLSTSLADRVRTGIELYRSGLAAQLVMSGGTGESGVDEAAAMRDFAVAAGVPASAIVLDSAGVNTDATVANTCAMADGGRLMVVSQFYHLPRIKLAYRAAGCDVYTVPAGESMPIAKTPLFVLREIPGFWVYWARAAARDMGL